ncbi:calcium-binding protein, partial [bacterium]|nr:calcium-binding protein [bacterium]
AGDEKIGLGAGQNFVIGDAGRIRVRSDSTTIIESFDAEVVGNDTVIVSEGLNVVVGGSGTDSITVLAFNDQDSQAFVIGDNGKITLQTSSAVLLSIESSDFDFGDKDLITLTAGTNVVIGGAGGDEITSQAGNNTILGDEGRAEFFANGELRLIESTNLGAGADDVITLSDGVNNVIAGLGADIINVGGGRNFVHGDEGRLEVLVDGSDETLISTLNATAGTPDDMDEIEIGAGFNVVVGGAAKDVINVKGTAVDARSSIIGDNGKITLQTSSAVLLSIESSDFDFGGEDQIHLTTGTNVVIAGNGDDSITAQAGINVILGDDGMAEFYTDGSLRLIESINLGTGGDDIIALSDGINDVIAGAGSDTITVRGRGVTNGINGDEGRLELLADDSGTNLIRKLNGPTGDSSGLDVMNVLPTNEVSESSHLTGNLLTGLNMESQILYLALEVLNIELNDATSKVIIENTHIGETKLTTSGGEDLVEVLATAGPTHIRTGLDRDIVSIQSIGAMMTVRTGSSSDVVNVGSLAPKTGGLLDGIQGPLSVDGELGDDQLNLDDSGDRSQNIGHLTSSVLTGLGVSDDITYFVEELNIDLGTARDVFNIQSSHIGKTNLTTSTGKDTVNVLSTAGMTHVDTGDDEDVVNIQSIGALMTVRTGAHNDSVRLGSLVPVSGGLLDGVSASLLIDGEEGEDRLDVDDSGDGLPNSGQLTSSLLTGLGMSDEVNYFVEELSIKLGTAGDSFTIEETHANRTKISMGAGDDRAAIASTSGPLHLEGELGDDTVHVATSDINGEISADEGFLEKIMGHLVFDGGGGVDRITANDSNDSSSETGTLTENSLTGFGFNSAPEVQTLTVVGESGFYRISRGEVNVPWYNIRPGVARPNALGVALDVQFSAGQIQDHLELIYGTKNVSVKLISEGIGIKTYGIAFIGELAGTDVAPIRWVDPGPINLVTNTHSKRAEIIIDTYTSVADSSPNHTQQFLEIVDSDRGTFTITLLDQTTDPLPFNITLEALTNALEPILNPNNIDRTIPFTDNFNIEKIGGRFLITFKAEHRDLAINGVDIDVNELRGGTVNLET